MNVHFQENHEIENKSQEKNGIAKILIKKFQEKTKKNFFFENQWNLFFGIFPRKKWKFIKIFFFK